MESYLQFPNLSTDRLILDELRAEDAEPLYRHFENKDVIEYYDLEAFTSLDQAIALIQLFKKRFDKALGIRWTIRLKNNSKLIGTCGFNSWNSKMKSTIIGYDISRDAWGNGYATEASREIIKLGFSGALPCGAINRIQGDTVPGNVASEAVLTKLGFKEEGLLRESGYWKGRFHDLKCFGLIKSEYNEV
jgi:ribosomal-protein-alanine N-acetyltransferase